MRSAKKCLIVLAGLMAGAAASAQEGAQLPPERRAHSYDVLLRRMDHYVDRSKKAAIVAALQRDRARLLALPAEPDFIAALNTTLFASSGDKHLSVFRASGAPHQADRAETNYGIVKAEVDAAGIGHLALSGFSNHPDSRSAIDAAMAKLAGARALVIDLRDNGGGGEVSLGRLLGHLFPARMELTAIEWRQCAPPPADRPDACAQIAPRLERRFTDPPATPAFPSRPVVVLVSARSFSAAEAAAFELQRLGRATIVGERTAGGGNPSAGMDLESELVVIMPIGRMRPPGGAAWEGTGVRPDVAAAAAEASEVALQRLR